MTFMKMPKIKISGLVFFMIILMGFMGCLKEIVFIYGIIILHECGHILFIKLFNGKIEKISITLLGGIVKTKLDDSTKKWQKLLINTGRNYY